MAGDLQASLVRLNENRPEFLESPDRVGTRAICISILDIGRAGVDHAVRDDLDANDAKVGSARSETVAVSNRLMHSSESVRFGTLGRDEPVSGNADWQLISRSVIGLLERLEVWRRHRHVNGARRARREVGREGCLEGIVTFLLGELGGEEGPDVVDYGVLEDESRQAACRIPLETSALRVLDRAVDAHLLERRGRAPHGVEVHRVEVDRHTREDPVEKVPARRLDLARLVDKRIEPPCSSEETLRIWVAPSEVDEDAFDVGEGLGVDEVGLEERASEHAKVRVGINHAGNDTSASEIRRRCGRVARGSSRSVSDEFDLAVVAHHKRLRQIVARVVCREDAAVDEGMGHASAGERGCQEEPTRRFGEQEECGRTTVG